MSNTTEQSDWLNFKPSADRPKAFTKDLHTLDAEEDVLRLDPLVEELARLMQLAARPDKNSHKIARRIGLLGGLGQGKTTAVHKSISLLHKQGVNLNCLSFDVANENPQDLEFQLDRLLGSLFFGRLVWRAARVWFWLSLLLSLPLLGLLILLHTDFLPALWSALQSIVESLAWTKKTTHITQVSTKWSDLLAKVLEQGFTMIGKSLLFASALSVTWVAVREIFPYLNRRMQRKHIFIHMHSPAPFLCRLKSAAKRILNSFNRVDVVLVDNLDRASVQQQRAVLRAVYKHQDDCPVCTLVVFDETQLLEQSKNDPESPEHLLAKALEVVLRMPDRQPMEAVTLALLAINELESQTSWQRALRQDRALGALAEVLLRLRFMSPRLAKRFVNDACVFLAQMASHWAFAANEEMLTAVRDPAKHDPHYLEKIVAAFAPAVFRLLAVWHSNPMLRTHSHPLYRYLEVPSTTHLQALLHSVGELDKQAKWINLLKQTRHLYPLKGSWSQWVAMASGGTKVSNLSLQAIKCQTDKTPRLESIPYVILDVYWQKFELLFARFTKEHETSLETSARLPAIALRIRFDLEALLADFENSPDVKNCADRNSLTVLQLHQFAWRIALRLWLVIHQTDYIKCEELLTHVLCYGEDYLQDSEGAMDLTSYRHEWVEWLVMVTSASGTLNSQRLRNWLGLVHATDWTWFLQVLIECPPQSLTWPQVLALSCALKVDSIASDTMPPPAHPGDNFELAFPIWAMQLKSTSASIEDLEAVTLAKSQASKQTEGLVWLRYLSNVWPDVKSDESDPQQHWDVLLRMCSVLDKPPPAIERAWYKGNFDFNAFARVFGFHKWSDETENMDIPMLMVAHNRQWMVETSSSNWNQWSKQARGDKASQFVLMLLLCMCDAKTLDNHGVIVEDGLRYLDEAPGALRWVYMALETGCVLPIELFKESDRFVRWRDFAVKNPEWVNKFAETLVKNGWTREKLIGMELEGFVVWLNNS